MINFRLVFRLVLVLSLVFSGICSTAADSRPDWESLYEAGVEAEDYADYKKAEALLEQACTLAQAGPYTRAEGLVCTKLGQTYAVHGRYATADATFSSLVERLRGRNTSPGALVSALLNLADMRASLGKRDETVEVLRETSRLLAQLPKIDRLRAELRISEYYLAARVETLGDKLLERLRSDLEGAGGPGDEEVLKLYRTLGYIAMRYAEPDTTVDILRPALDFVEANLDDYSALTADQQESYLEVMRLSSDAIEGAGDQAAATRLRTSLREWRGLHKQRTADVYRTVGTIPPARVLRKSRAATTRGARQVGVEAMALLDIEIWPDGRAHNVRVVHGPPFGLTWSSVAAVRQWRFEPSTLNGKPIKCEAKIAMMIKTR